MPELQVSFPCFMPAHIRIQIGSNSGIYRLYKPVRSTANCMVILGDIRHN